MSWWGWSYYLSEGCVYEVFPLNRIRLSAGWVRGEREARKAEARGLGRVSMGTVEGDEQGMWVQWSLLEDRLHWGLHRLVPRTIDDRKPPTLNTAYAVQVATPRHSANQIDIGKTQRWPSYPNAHPIKPQRGPRPQTDPHSAQPSSRSPRSSPPRTGATPPPARRPAPCSRSWRSTRPRSARRRRR